MPKLFFKMRPHFASVRQYLVGPLLAAALLVVGLSAAATAQEIYFAPREPRAPWVKVKGDPDWPRFFDADAPWQRALSHIRGIELQEGYIDDASDAELTRTAAALAKRSISIIVPLQSIAIDRGDNCGRGEGFAGSEYSGRIAAKLKRLGITPKLILLDGPLDFGHYEPGQCRFPIDKTAQRAAATAKIFLGQFPDLQIGDVESSALPLHPNWQSDYQAFKRALETAAERPVESLILDVKWRSADWPDRAAEMAALARSSSMRFGMIYNGDDRDENDRAWVAHAERNFIVLESQRGLVPDIAVFSSWNDYPTHALPETSPQTMSWLIDRYLLPRTRFEAHREGTGWRVRLIDQTGHALPEQNVAIERLGLDPSQPVPVRTASGTVPGDAAAAMIFFRVNAECNCAGANDLLVGELTYRENGGRVSQHLNLADLAGKPRSDGIELTPGPPFGQSAVTRMRVGADARFMYTSARFPVTPGAHYEFRVPLGAIDADGLFGFARLVWRDRDDKPIGGPIVLDEGDRTAAGAAVTDRDGFFSVSASAQGQELSFAGSDKLRPALARLPASQH